jgi:hypothetical protein
MAIILNGTAGITTPAIDSVAQFASADMPAGSVLQVASTVFQGVGSTTANGYASTITNGLQVFSLSFTPLLASSNILVQTSSVAISESTNGADIAWLALWNGSTFVAANSGTWFYTNFGGNLNSAYTSINEIFAAGSTATRTIQVRAAMQAGAQTTYINGNVSNNYTGTSAQIRMTVMEIAA